MDWQEAIKEERAKLQSSIILLLSLAGLAERAASRSVFTRVFLIWILRRGEAAAIRLVQRIASECGYALSAPDLSAGGYSAEEALDMAEGFRELAENLKFLSRRAVAQWRRAGRLCGQQGEHPAAKAEETGLRMFAMPRLRKWRRLSAHALSLGAFVFVGRILAPDTS